MTDNYGVKEYLEEYREALEQTREEGEQNKVKTKKPNLIERLRAGTKLASLNLRKQE